MKKELPIINDREQSKRQYIADLVLTDIEKFRTEASKIYGKFTPAERFITKGLEGSGVDSYSVLAAWQDELVPLIHSLQKTRTDDNFRKIIIKNLIIDESEVQSKLDLIIKNRQIEIIDNFTYKLYPINKTKRKDIYKKQRKLARELLSRPESEIEQIKEHQINYMLYMDASEKNEITVIDPHDRKSKQRKTIKQIKIERKKVLASEAERLNYIKGRLEALSAMNGGILVDIFNKEWDLMTILALRNQYEKLIGKLAASDTNDAIKRLEVFDKVTSQFKNEQAAKLAVNSDQTSLTTTRTIVKKIDTLLLNVFDLTTIQKNQLVLNAKEYRELTHEQSEIIKTQNNRTACL